MFRELMNFSYQRTPLQAVGWYLTFLVMGTFIGSSIAVIFASFDVALVFLIVRFFFPRLPDRACACACAVPVDLATHRVGCLGASALGFCGCPALGFCGLSKRSDPLGRIDHTPKT
jgi:hypothetical protein